MKAEDARKVALLFQKVANIESNQIDMETTHILDLNYGNVCGTVACHAGWYAFCRASDADVRWNDCNGDEEKMLFWEKPMPDSYGLLHSQNVSWLDGSLMLAKDLGFLDRNDLCLWAQENLKIWGNEHGYSMFTSPLAFGVECHLNLTLQHVADHWHGVADRLEMRDSE